MPFIINILLNNFLGREKRIENRTKTEPYP